MELFNNLVVKTKNDTIEKIDKCCTGIYKTKLEALSMLSERDNSQESKKCILIDNNEYLKDLNNYIPNLLTYLWENPKLVSILLSNSNIQDIKDNLASFIVNNFYENILSSYYIEDNLMYVLTLMLKEEINKLENINNPESFLNESSPCGYLLYELRRKNDIQYFFKNTILNVIDDLEKISYKIFNLRVTNIVDNFIKKNQELKDKKFKKSKIQIVKDKSLDADDLYKKPLDDQNDKNLDFEEKKKRQYAEKERENLDQFTERYIASLSLSEIKKMIIEQYADFPDIKNYCCNQLINCKDVENNEKYYSNQILMDNIYSTEISQEVLYYYQKHFFKIINYIDQILTNLKNNLYILPYSVKCLCKIISILIEKKFPDINATQKNAYIANFFFQKLLIPILSNPGVGVLINNFIISDNTLKNLKIINHILSQFVSGKLFNNQSDSDFTPFNWYFLEKMPEILEIFEKITKVTLPHFIEELLNDKLDDNFQYDYFKENPDEIMFHRSICFNLNDISSLLNSLDNCKDVIFVKDPAGLFFQKTFEKLNNNKNRKLLTDLKSGKNLDSSFRKSGYKKQEKKEKEKEKESIENAKNNVNYFLITSLITNDKYKELFDLQYDNTPNYIIKEIKQPTDTNEIIKNNIIKVKNYFSTLLYNYRKLIITDFDEGTTSDTVNILKILKNFIKSSNNVVDDSIPSEWYIDSLLEYLNKIPEEIRNNDFEKLYDEIEEDLNIAIKKLDFEVMSVCLDKLKFTKRGTNYYEEAIKSTKDLELNEKVKEIIEGEYIPVEINFKYSDEQCQNVFDIVKSKIKEKDYLRKQIKIKNSDFCPNIREFTEKFPDLSIYQVKQDVDIFKLQKKLLIPEKIEGYFNIIDDYLKSNKKFSSLLDIGEINDKIYDYVMNKIYDKIFPKTNDKDDKIFSQSIMLSWTEPKHFIPGKTNYVFDSFLPEVKDFFKLMDKEKSPRKKLLYVKKIFDSILKVVKFNGGDVQTGVDDEMPILNYALTKARPIRIFSNLQLMELYIGERGSKGEGSQLTQLIASCDFIINIKYNNLNDITKEEFTRKCNNAASGEILQS